jgi:hypothetical protein
MDTQTFQDLLTPAGQEILLEAENLQPVEADFLKHFTVLNRRFPEKLARAALETAILRQEARDKFPQASRMYFTREALQQASSAEVSAYRSQRYRGFEVLADLGCSVGGDSLSLASLAPTIGIDIDRVRLQMAHANLTATGLGGRGLFVQADLGRSLILNSPASMGLFFDPARRAEGKRIFSVKEYHPPLSLIQGWLPDFPALGVKISPGVNLAELDPYEAEIEFISLRRELKEAVLWFGPLKTSIRRATVLPGAHTFAVERLPAVHSTMHTAVSTSGAAELPVGPPRAVLYEPDPSILRAGLVGELGKRLGAAQLDASISYLTADVQIETPFARSWLVEDWLPFGLKRLRAYLRSRGVGRVVVKKRGSPLEPDALIQNLRLKGEGEKTVFLTQCQGKPIAIIARAEVHPG